MLSSWFIGSITIADYTFTVDGFDIDVPAGTYYLTSTTASLSLMGVIATEIVAQVGGTCTFVLTRGRRSLFTFNTSRNIDWTGATTLRNILGYRENAASGTTVESEYASALLWSPGYLATPRTIEGVDGYTIPHQSILKSADGTQVQCDHYGSEQWQDLSWSHIQPERMREATTHDAEGGTFHEFYEQCAMLRRRILWHSVDELDGSSTAATLDTARGPYILRPDFTGDWYARTVPNAEVSCSMDLPLHQVAEYS